MYKKYIPSDYRSCGALYSHSLEDSLSFTNINYILKSCMSVASWFFLVYISPLANLFTIIFLPRISIKSSHLLHYFSAGLHRSPFHVHSCTVHRSVGNSTNIQSSTLLHKCLLMLLGMWLFFSCGFNLLRAIEISSEGKNNNRDK